MHSHHALNAKLTRKLREICFETVKFGYWLEPPCPHRHPKDYEYFAEPTTVLSEITFVAFLNPSRKIPEYCLKFIQDGSLRFHPNSVFAVSQYLTLGLK